MLKWIKKNIGLCLISCLVILFLLIGMPIIINMLFKFNSRICFLEAEWSASDALSYYGAILSFIGTVVLGVLALYQNHIIKMEADKKAAEIEKQQWVENMPKFYVRLKGANGFCGNLVFLIHNVSNNIAYDVEIYDLKIKKGSLTLWESQDTYYSPVINPQKQIEVKTKSKAISEENEVVLFASMLCKDKYYDNHEYLLKMICKYPNNYEETDVMEI